MPPRWLCIAIALFWLGTTGPLLWKEIRPWFLTRQPPSYTFDLLDQAQGEQVHPIRWKVYTGDREPELAAQAHLAESWVRFQPESDTYTLHTRLIASRIRGNTPIGIGLVTLREVTTVERVRSQDLRLIGFEMKLTCEFLGVQEGRFSSSGEIQDGKLKGQYEVHLPGLDGTFPLPEFTPPNNGAIQLPLHLVNRISGLRPGQSWDVPMIDPVATLLNVQGGALQLAFKNVEASVSETPEPFPGHPNIRCLVITYDNDTKTKVYVQVGTDLVLRQEATYQGTKIVIERMNLDHDR